MNFDEFAGLAAGDVATLVARGMPGPLGVAVDFDGTRRWYMKTHSVGREDLYGDGYATATMREVRRVTRMIFEDGARAVYCPALSVRIEAERGPEYARFQIEKLVEQLASDEMLSWCRDLGIELSCYGATHRLPPGAREIVETLGERTRSRAKTRYMRWSVFAGSPYNDVFSRVVRLFENRGVVPTDVEVIEQYYGGPHVPLAMWVGHKFPSVSGVPLLLNGRTSLYFLQFPTPLLDLRAWRRLLFDTLYVRGEQSSLHPDDVPSERRILGLGVRVDGCWQSMPDF
jgi:hypothetical protein